MDDNRASVIALLGLQFQRPVRGPVKYGYYEHCWRRRAYLADKLLEGIRAAKENVTDNPYKSGSIEALHWADGWSVKFVK